MQVKFTFPIPAKSKFESHRYVERINGLILQLGHFESVIAKRDYHRDEFYSIIITHQHDRTAEIVAELTTEGFLD